MNSLEQNLPDYIGLNSEGYPFNKEFPPNTQKYGWYNNGYPNGAAETFLYDNLVQGYGVVFSYNGKDYLIGEGENNILTNLTDRIQIVFASPIDLVKEAVIEDIPLLTLIIEDRLENVDIQ